MEQSKVSAEISLREVYDAVMDLKHELNRVPEDVKDHEARIRVLERKIWLLAGGATVAGGGLAQLFQSLTGS